MPKAGFKAITITERVYDQMIKNMEQINGEAGYNKIRNISHFVEEAIVSFIMNALKRDAEEPEELIRKILDAVWDRPDVLNVLMKRLVNLPGEEAIERLQKMLDSEELTKLKVVCASIET